VDVFFKVNLIYIVFILKPTMHMHSPQLLATVQRTARFYLTHCQRENEKNNKILAVICDVPFFTMILEK
jgi:hypothetical protein